MKLRIALSVLALLTCTAASAKEMVVAFSPFETPELASENATRVLSFLAELEPGSRATILNAETLASLGTFEVPTNPAYRNARARLAANGPVVGATIRMGKTPPKLDERVAGAMRWPQLFQAIGQTLSPPAGSDVLLIGSPIYDAPADPAFAMSGERFPSDAHLDADRQSSLYGTKDTPNFLRGLRIHLVHPDTPSLRTERYRQAVLRFWTLYVQRQGGELVSFTVDLQSALARITSGASAPVANYAAEGNGRVEMIRLRPDTVPTTIYERPLSTQALREAEIRQAVDLEIGLSWDCGSCDVDLYARPHPGAQVLYFGNMDTAEGRYWKDFHRSPQQSGGFETISFKVPVDLRSARVLINHYGGNAAQPIEAELRISTWGQTYARRVRLGAGDGNRGTGVREVLNGGPDSAKTIVIDLRSILPQ